MVLTFFISCLGCFVLTALTNALRTLTSSGASCALKEVGFLFWYRRFHQLFFKKDELSTLFLSTILTRFLLLFIAIVSGVHVFSSPLQLILLFILIWLFADFLPRLYGIKFPKDALRVTSPIASLFLLLVSPFHLLLLSLPDKIIKPLSLVRLPDSDLLEMLENARTKSIDSHNRKLIEAVVSFKDRIVREVMVPRVNVFSLPSTMSIKEAAEFLLKEGYSRVPIYKGSIDSIIGLLMYKDVLGIYVKCQKNELPQAYLDETISQLVKPVLYTPETKRVSHLLQDFRSRQLHLAIVVDEYGGTEGIVTIEDIIEEIVGDIADEYDVEEEMLFTKQPSGGIIVDAKMTILDIEDHFGLKIPSEGDYDTIGGYIFHKTGTIPRKGFHIYHDDFELEVLNSTDRGIDKVRITSRKIETD